MKINELRRFQPFYSYANYFQAAHALRQYLDLPEDHPIPLGLPHGIDFGQFARPLDLGGPEPLYWAFNKHLLDGAQGVKPALPIPHPIWLSVLRSPPGPGKGTLVIGPPPSPVNDHRLLEHLRERGNEDLTILVKGLPNYRTSIAFWQGAGFKAVSLRDFGPLSYPQLADILAQYAHVVGSTISSALFFAGAMGRSIELLRGYRFVAYESPEIEKVGSFMSARGVATVGILARGDVADTTAVSKELLGAEFESNPALLREALERSIEAIRNPIHCDVRYPHILRPLLGELALRTGRHGLLTKSPIEWLRRRRNPQVVVQELDEVSLWLDGRSSINPRWTPAAFVPGLTIPGNPVDAY